MMKSGKIEQFAHFSQFATVKEFNETIAHYLQVHGDKFTKGERIAFDHLTRFSVKYIGVCNARICKLVQACQTTKGGISRSTFERMLRKANKFGIIKIYHTVRETGGLSHSVYVFQRIDGAKSAKVTDHELPKKPCCDGEKSGETTSETTFFKANNKIKDLRPSIDNVTIEELDQTFVPTYVPKQFVQVVKPFFNRAKEICELWDRAAIAYRSAKLELPIDTFLPTILESFKETVYRYKQRRIRTTFTAYYYGILIGKMTVEKRKLVAEQQKWGQWLVGC